MENWKRWKCLNNTWYNTICLQSCKHMFGFWFWALLVTKLWKYYVILDYILQGKMGKKEKNGKKNHATNVTKILKTKRRKYRINKTFSCPLYQRIWTEILHISNTVKVSINCSKIDLLAVMKQDHSFLFVLWYLSLKIKSLKMSFKIRLLKNYGSIVV